MVDYLRSCYRSVWRLSTDPAILTPGRFYFAPEGTPPARVGSLRGSRNYVAENGQSFLEWGELDGKQKWDNGAPPIFLPLPRIVGSYSCLADGEPHGEQPERSSNFFRTVCIGGRDYRFPTITYASFSVARHDREFTYFNDVPLTLVDATCEARYEGPSGIPNTTAVVRVTDVPDGSLATNFYLVDTSSIPVMIVTTCCTVPSILRTDFSIAWVLPGPFPITTQYDFTNLPLVYDEALSLFSTNATWVCEVTLCGDVCQLLMWCTFAGGNLWNVAIFKKHAVPPATLYWNRIWKVWASTIPCSPFLYDFDFAAISMFQWTDANCGFSAATHIQSFKFKAYEPA